MSHLENTHKELWKDAWPVSECREQLTQLLFILIAGETASNVETSTRAWSKVPLPLIRTGFDLCENLPDFSVPPPQT
jgi:hypothetical protein